MKFVLVSSGAHLGQHVLLVRLENRHFVFATSADAIALSHQLTELIKRLENMNSNALVEASRLEEPQVLSLVATLGDFENAFNVLLILLLILGYFLINCGNFLCQALLLGAV